jgi:penicillin-binding protein 2
VRVYSEGQHGGPITKNSALEWKLRDHALFIGYAPVIDPKYAIVSIIEHGATPDHPHVQMARDVMLFCQQRDPAKLPPAYPLTSSADAEPAPRKLAKAGN